ncbi:hypothetical protein ACSTHP_00140, partial [Vibrio parahaemolyticus]
LGAFLGFAQLALVLLLLAQALLFCALRGFLGFPDLACGLVAFGLLAGLRFALGLLCSLAANLLFAVTLGALFCLAA